MLGPFLRCERRVRSRARRVDAARAQTCAGMRLSPGEGFLGRLRTADLMPTDIEKNIDVS
jgi:hypothetical protein